VRPPQDIPPEAELFLVGDFMREKEPTPSRILKNRFQVQERLFHCPRCGLEREEPEHARDGKCRGCNLRWRAYGNALWIWTAEQDEALREYNRILDDWTP